MARQDQGYHWQESTLVIKLYLQPNARHEGFDGTHGERIKVRIAAPAIDNKANHRLINYLANLFSVPKSAVKLVKGEKSRNKTIHINNPRELPGWITE